MTESGKKNGTILAFLRARLDEDEAVAKAGRFHKPSMRPSRAGWNAYLEGGSDGYAIEDEDGAGGFIVGNEGPARHIARHDPARVLREVEAKRRLIEIQLDLLYAADDEDSIVRAIAAVYDQHRDYDPSWRP